MQQSISAMGKAVHTRFRLPVSDIRYAIGISNTSRRAKETIKEYILLPKAWKTEEATTDIPAVKKENEVGS